MSYFLYYNALTAEIQILFCDITYYLQLLQFNLLYLFRNDLLT